MANPHVHHCPSRVHMLHLSGPIHTRQPEPALTKLLHIPPYLRRVIPRMVPTKLAQVALSLIEPDDPVEVQVEPEADGA